MTEKFDPYHQWLGIPAGDQPPHFYRLLGIPPFEENAAVIDNAANQRMAHLRTFQTGPYSAFSQRLLNEVAAARVCLLNQQKKTAYDHALRQRLAGKPRAVAIATDAGVFDPALASVIEMNRPGASTIGTKRKQNPKQTDPKLVAMIAGGAAVIVLLGVIGFWLANSGGSSSAKGDIAGSGDPATSAKPVVSDHPKSTSSLPRPPARAPVVPASIAPGAEEQRDVADVAGGHSGTQPTSSRSKSATVHQPAAEANSAEAAPQTPASADAAPADSKAPADAAEANPIDNPLDGPAKKIDPPAPDVQKRLLSEIDEVYKPNEAKDQAAKEALAHKLLDDGRKSDSNRAERFALLRRAGEIARDAGDADLMFEAVDTMSGDFNIRPAAIKARWLKQLVSQGLAGGAAQIAAVTAACVKLVDEAAASDAASETSEVVEAVLRSLSKQNAQAVAAQRMAKAAAARARAAADKAEQKKKLAAAEDEVEAIKAAQAALSDCNKSLQTLIREREAIQVARLKLKANPDDPESCLAVGRWTCFYQEKWDDGLKLLAKGSDPDLKSLATTELASKPATADERVARGDAWWDLSEKAAGKPRAAMQRRAAQWYHEALPDLAEGLGRAKVQTRLDEIAAAPAVASPRLASTVRPPLAVAPFEEETARQLQARWAKYLRVPVVQTNSIGMKLAVIPPGEYMMGSPQTLMDETNKMKDLPAFLKEHLMGEAPQHKVRITRPFLMGVTAVTQDEYQRVTGLNHSNHKGDPQLPVESVIWHEAMKFCELLSDLPEEKKAHRHYVLPTEAQWEYACRAGTTTRWYTGEKVADYMEAAWDKENSGDMSHPVAQKRPNPWGLYDMHGNVSQWCQDYYDNAYYTKSPTDDPPGPASGDSHVSRGGAYYHANGNNRSAYRNREDPIGARFTDGGLRVVVVIEDKPSK